MTVQSAFAICLTVLLFSCQESINQEFTGEDGEPRLLGKIDQQGLEKQPYADWFQPGYEAYAPDPEAMGNLEDKLGDYHVQVFMGTWCSDSQREVPNLLKLLEEAGFPGDQLEIIAIDDADQQYKQSPGGEEVGKNIHHVPTVIFYKDGKEVNRIIEYPVGTLEEDIVRILDGDYTPYYDTANQVNTKLNELGLEAFVQNLDKLAAEFKGRPDNSYELNTLAKVLYYSDRVDEAIAVSRLNLKLHPQDAYAHAALAKRLNMTGKKDEALAMINRALELEPDDMEYQGILEEIQGGE